MTDEPVAVTLARIDERVERIDRHLFGNGQPGKLAEFDHRLDACEHTDTKLYTVVGVLVFLLLAVGAWAEWVR